MNSTPDVVLPGLDCGLCGVRTCAELAARLNGEPHLLKRCIHLSGHALQSREGKACNCGPSPCGRGEVCQAPAAAILWRDSLDREFDFYLEHFPEEPGPREILIPHNPLLVRELDIQRGDLLVGRPLGLSCGCPITHCGVAVDVDQRTGVLSWCVTGPLGPREKGFKDLGYYSAQAYEGLVRETRVDLRIGGRYWFQPRMCMLQWRHSGLVNYHNRTAEGLQVRVEGLWIG